MSGPVAGLLTSLSPRVLTRVRLGLRAFEWLPFPWRFSRLDLAAREDFLRRMERSRLGLYHELLLMAKTFTTLGYAIDPRVEKRLGLETSCRVGDGSPPAAGRPVGRPRAGGRRRGMRRRHRRLGRRRRCRRGDARRGRPRRDRARGGRQLLPRQLPEQPTRRYRLSLPRRWLDDRRGPPTDPGAGRENGRRHDGDQLGDLLPRPRAGARALARPIRGRVGRPPGAGLRRGRGVPAGDAARPGADGAQRPAGDGGSGGDRRQRRSDLAQCRQLRPVQLLPVRLPDRRQAGHARQLHASRGRGRGPAADRGRGAPRRGRERSRRGGSLRGQADREAQRRPPPVHGPRPPRDDRRGRGPRHAGAAAALRPRWRPGRPQPPHAPRLLGRRPLRGGGARLGRRDAELLRRRVGAGAGPARGDLHATPLRRRLATGLGPRAPGGDARLRPRELDRRPAHRRVHRPGRDSPRRLDSRRLQVERRGRPPGRLRHRPRRRDPLRGRGQRGLPQHRPRPGAAPRRGRRVRGDPLQAVGASPRGLSPDGHGQDRRRARRGRLRQRRIGPRRRRTCTSPTHPSSPPPSA